MLQTATDLPRRRLSDLPAVGAADMREIDRLAVEEFAIGLAEMMELAGANTAHLAERLLERSAGRRVSVLVGPGNNGAGGLVAARHLANRGARVHVVLAKPVGRLRPMARERIATLLAMSVPCCVAIWDLADEELDDLLTESSLVVDALLGYAADGAPRDTIAILIERINASRAPVLSLDLPSGVSADTGTAGGPAVKARATLTIALPKRGLLRGDGRARSGELFLADIGLPAALYARAGIELSDPFADGAIVRLD